MRRGREAGDEARSRRVPLPAGQDEVLWRKPVFDVEEDEALARRAPRPAVLAGTDGEVERGFHRTLLEEYGCGGLTPTWRRDTAASSRTGRFPSWALRFPSDGTSISHVSAVFDLKAGGRGRGFEPQALNRSPSSDTQHSSGRQWDCRCYEPARHCGDRRRIVGYVTAIGRGIAA